MADDASRLQHLTDSEFLHHFNSVYPQETPWTLCQSQPKMTTSLTSSLQRRGNFKRMLRPPKGTLALHGAVGCATALRSKSRPTLQGTLTPFKSSKSTSSDSAKDVTTRGARHPSKLTPFLNTSQPLSRRTSSWWTRPKPTWDCGNLDKSGTSPSVTSCMPSREQILLPNRVWPINTTILLEVMSMAQPKKYSEEQWSAICQLVAMGFCSLLQPDKYVKSRSNARDHDTLGKPFRIRHASFLLKNGKYHAAHLLTPRCQCCCTVMTLSSQPCTWLC